MAESGDPELSDESAHLSLWAGGTSVGVARGNGPYRAPENAPTRRSRDMARRYRAGTAVGFAGCRVGVIAAATGVGFCRH